MHSLTLCCVLLYSAVVDDPVRLFPQSSRLTVEYTSAAKPKLPIEQLKFGATMSDHMLEIDWDAKKGWHAPKIIPYGPLKLDPAASSLHYGLEVR
jgi:branched-chain amino acid aminotransferase